MISSRKLSDLHPTVSKMAADFLAKAESEGIDVLVTSTYRDIDAQDALYAQGRSKPGKIVTNARGGKSWHNWRVAFDVVPMRNGKPIWDTKTPENFELWKRIGGIGKSVGLEWAGDWKTFREYPHFQRTKDYPNGFPR